MTDTTEPKKVNQMEELYNCPICHDILVMPTVLSCGHTYCANCVKLMENKVCSLDNKPFNSKSINYALKSIIEEVYKDNEQYKQRLYSEKCYASYKKNVKILKSQPVFNRIRREIDMAIGDGIIQISTAVLQYGYVTFWTAIDELQKNANQICIHGDFMYESPIDYIIAHQDRLSKEEILKIISPNRHEVANRFIVNTVSSEEFHSKFNEYMKSIESDIEKTKAIRKLIGKLGRVHSHNSLMVNLGSSVWKRDFRHMCELLDISIDTIYNKETNKWIKISEKNTREIYLTYKKTVRDYEDDVSISSTESDTESSE
jgi:hypothetical protein